MEKVKLIYLSGIMASGKTTLAPKLAALLPHSQLFLENVDENLFLKDFFSDMKKWGFHSRIAFLAVKTKIYRQISTTTKHAIIDRGFYELLPYAKLHFDLGNLSEREYITYTDLYQNFQFLIPGPDLIIYFTCSTDRLIERIKTRSREMEQTVSRAYIEQGQAYYKEWFQSVEAKKKLTIDTSDFTLQSYDDVAINLAKEIVAG